MTIFPAATRMIFNAGRLRLALLLGCVALVGCGSDSSRIVGRWKYQMLGSKVMEFFPDGTMADEAPIMTAKGTYKLVGQRLEIEEEGMLWGTNKLSWHYKFDGDTIHLTDCDKADGYNLDLQRLK